MRFDDPEPTHDLTLWTGGWDSTFRVLYRAVVEERAVRPVYVVDRGRGSASMELRAINRVLRDLESDWPEAFSRIEPPRFVDLYAIPEAPEVREAYDRLSASVRAEGRRVLGSQYRWLPRLARSAGWTDVELSVHGAGHLRQTFGPHLKRGDDGVVRVRPDAPDHMRVLLGPFTFPLWGGSKTAEYAQAERAGFSSLLDKHAWFCFSPRRGRPCGACNPCADAARDGFGSHVPLDRRVIGGASRAVAKTRFRLGLGTRFRALVGGDRSA